MRDALAEGIGLPVSARPPAEDDYRRLLGYRKALGITRLADITGLDIAGIPVVQATRPFSLSNAVSQGKGETLAQAAVSAMFEAVESFFAERLDRFETTNASVRQLAVPEARVAMFACNDDWMDAVVPWVEAKNLTTGDANLVPLELVHTAYTAPMAGHDGVFHSSTTGLAAGFSNEHATCHAILEVIERDAIARAMSTHGFLHRRRLDPASFRHAALTAMLERLRRRGLMAGFWHAPSPTGVPVVWCHLMEDCPPDLALLSSPAEGSAAAFDPAAAALAALLEAAQSRLTAISGARDDFTRANYPKYPDLQRIAAHRHLLLDGPKPLRAEAAMEIASLASLLQHVQRAGIDQVYAVTIETEPCEELAVVKVIMPDLLPLVEA